MKKVFLFVLISTLTLSVVAQKSRFGHVNTEAIFALMPEKDSLTKALEDYAKTLESELTSLNKEFEAKYTEYSANEATYSPSVKQMKYDELSTMQQRIQAFQVSAQQDMQQKQTEMLEPLYDKIRQAIKTVGEQKSLMYVFEEATLLYFSNESVDVTNDVKIALGIK